MSPPFERGNDVKEAESDYGRKILLNQIIKFNFRQYSKCDRSGQSIKKFQLSFSIMFREKRREGGEGLVNRGKKETKGRAELESL